MYFVIVALFFNTASSMMAFGGTGKNGTLICTLQGYQWVSFNEEGNTLDVNDSTPSPSEHCKVCLFPANNDNIDDYQISSQSLTQFSSIKISFFDDIGSVEVSPPYLFAQGRAPPSLV